MGRHDPSGNPRTGWLVNCQTFICEEEKQVELQELRRDRYVGGSKLPATDTYRTTKLSHVIDIDNRQRLLVLIKWRPPRVARLQPDDALFRPAREVSANNINHPGGSRCDCHEPHETVHFGQSIENVVGGRHGSLAICAAESSKLIELLKRHALCKYL